jgi:putative redox protein
VKLKKSGINNLSDMEKRAASVRWLENMAFETEVNGHKIYLDAEPESGGENKGPRPKNLMLSALGGCTAMDVVAILRKMRVELTGLNVIVEGDLTEEHPKHFSRMHIIYEFSGKDLPADKLKKAVDLSQERYCGVSAVYKKAMEITSEIKIIE